ncbi:MAG TPA: hypothetical protein VK184_23420 [Nostocaceae cyanobacterium]|nr:hypothetical protein [Nostocaceae cyanobacterium]
MRGDHTLAGSGDFWGKRRSHCEGCEAIAFGGNRPLLGKVIFGEEAITLHYP